MISIVRFFSDNNAHLVYKSEKAKKIALDKISRDLGEKNASSDIEKYGDVFLDNSLSKTLGGYLNNILQSTPFYNMGIREFQKYLEDPYFYSEKRKAPSDFFKFDESRLGKSVDTKRGTFNIAYVFNLFLLPMPSSQEIEKYAKYARIGFESVNDKEALKNQAPLPFALKFFKCLEEDLRVSNAANILPYFRDIAGAISEIIIPSIENAIKSSNNIPLEKNNGGMKAFDCLKMFNGCGFTKNITDISSSEQVTKSMISYVKKVAKCSDSDIFTRKNGKTLLLNIEFAMNFFQSVKKVAYDSPFCKLGIDPVILKYDEYFTILRESSQQQSNDDVIVEATLNPQQQERIIKNSEKNGVVNIFNLLFDAGYGEITGKAIQTFRKMKIDIDGQLGCSRSGAIAFCKYMNNEIKKWEPYRMKFPYVMEQAQFFERAYLYYGGLRENLDDGVTSNKFFDVEMKKKKAMADILSAMMEKVMSEIKSMEK